MKYNSKIVIEIVGIISVVASLIFVGLQFVFDRKIALAEQYQNRAEVRVQGALGQLGSEALISDRTAIWMKNRPRWWNDEIERIFIESGDSMDAIVRRQIGWEIFAVNMDNNYYQYKQGFLEESSWLQFRETIKRVMRNPMRKSFYLSIAIPNLAEVINELAVELDLEE